MNFIKYNIQFIVAFGFVLLFAQCDKSSLTSNTSISNTGKAGSLARFTIVNNYLYTIDFNQLQVFDISNPKDVIFKSKVYVGENIETIFPFRDKLFIASNSGMFMYSLADPINPKREANVQHITGCDPVVANATHAYLTIRSGRTCGTNNLNVLQVYQLGTNVAAPIFVTQIAMNNPIGLGLKGKYLFVADKGRGLVVFDITNGNSPVEKTLITGEDFVDVIVYDDLLVCMTEDGISYYNTADMNNITKLSSIN